MSSQDRCPCCGVLKDVCLKLCIGCWRDRDELLTESELIEWG